MIACASGIEIMKVHDHFLGGYRAGARWVAERICTWYNIEVKLVPIKGLAILKPFLS